MWNISTESTCLDQACTCNFPNGPIEGCQGSPTLGCCPFGTPHIDRPGNNRRIPDRRTFGIHRRNLHSPMSFHVIKIRNFRGRKPQGKMRKFSSASGPTLTGWFSGPGCKAPGIRTDLPWHQAAPSILQQLTGNWNTERYWKAWGQEIRHLCHLHLPGIRKGTWWYLMFNCLACLAFGLATDCYQAMSAGAVQFAACLGSDSVGFRTICTWPRAEKHAA